MAFYHWLIYRKGLLRWARAWAIRRHMGYPLGLRMSSFFIFLSQWSAHALGDAHGLLNVCFRVEPAHVFNAMVFSPRARTHPGSVPAAMGYQLQPAAEGGLHGVISNTARKGPSWDCFKHRPSQGGLHGVVSQKTPSVYGIVSNIARRKGDCMGLFSNNRPRPFWGIAICPVIRSAPRAAVPAPAPAVRCSFRRGSRPGAIPSALRCRKRACSKGPCIPTGAGPAIGNNPRRAGAANCTPRNRRAERLCE